MMSEHFTNKDNKYKEITEDFDYSKLTEEMETMLEYLEQLSEEIIKMKVECAITNIELASTVDAIDFESKIQHVEQIIEKFGYNHQAEEKMEETDDQKMPSAEKNKDTVHQD